MINLPSHHKKWEYENAYYLTSDPSRMGKFIAHYELYKMSTKITGDIIECGVFKGASFIRFCTFEQIFNNGRKKVIGFDSFGAFPSTKFKKDLPRLRKYIKEAGNQSISTNQLQRVLRNKNLNINVELIKGNILNTVPEYVKSHPHLIISLLHIDTDVYEPAVIIMKYLFPRLSPGGLLILDDYNKFPGETKAVNDYLGNKRKNIKRFQFAPIPYYYIQS